MSLPGPHGGVGVLRAERWQDRMMGRWELRARVPLFDRPGGSLVAWIFDGWLVPEGGVARPLGRGGMVPAGSENALSWIVEEVRDGGWLRFRYADGDSGVAWTHDCLFALGPDALAVTAWEDVLEGALWLTRGPSRALREQPADGAPLISELCFGVDLFRRELRGDWIRVAAGVPEGNCGGQAPAATHEGWMRWRDSAGHVTVVVQPDVR